MKKIVALLLLVGSSLLGTSYDEVRENFKKDLYLRQHSLMEHDQYIEFIEPHLQQAEQSLKTAAYCRQNPDSCLTQEYLSCLRSCIVAGFHSLTRPNDLAVKRYVSSCQRRLSDLIAKIKETNQVKDLDLTVEINQSIELCNRVNAAYYKNLSFSAKTSVYFAGFIPLIYR